MTDIQPDSLEQFLGEYCDVVDAGFTERWKLHTPEIYNNEISEAIGGLAARQATLAIEVGRNPGIWNSNIAPLILRCMTDTHITLAWILASPQDRSKEYIRFGLGQEKLFIEYLQNEADQIPEGEIDDQIEQLIEIRKGWLNSQLMEWAIEVNVGSWSGKSTREMAAEAGCESLYKFAYVPFSGPAHSMWQHVGIHNVVPCKNPLHKNHRIPIIPEPRLDPDFLYRSSKYVSRTFDLLTKVLDLPCSIPLPVDFFLDKHPFQARGGNKTSN
jgi:hypothetical protein